MQLIWMVIEVSIGASSIPYISIAMIAAVYGLQVRHRILAGNVLNEP